MAMLPNLQINDNKAGMEGLDTERINEIIRSASAGSNYFNHQLKRQQRIDAKIKEMNEKLNSFSTAQIDAANKKMDEIVASLEDGRDMSQTIVHIDMDAFYAAVETRDNPTLKDKPMAVGSSSMLSTSNYIARRFGIRAAMPGFIGLKLCPQLVIVPLNFKKYQEVSEEVRSVLGEYDPEFCAMSLDEAYLNITDYMKKASKSSESPEEIVQEMREKIFTKTQLTASAGIAPNGLLAKVGSDRNKPNGQFYIPPDKKVIEEFIATLPVRKVCGIGNQTEQLLKALDIKVCADLLKNRGILSMLFSSISCRRFMEIALGLGTTHVKSDESRKSMSVERTFNDTSNVAELLQWSKNFCEELAGDMKKHQILGKTVTLKLKTTDFEVKTRAITLPDYTADSQKIFVTVEKLLNKEINSASKKPLTLRLMGVRMSTLLDEADHNSSLCQKDILSFFQDGSEISLPSATDRYVCPICSERFKKIQEINEHIDSCLVADAPDVERKTETSMAHNNKLESKSMPASASNSDSFLKTPIDGREAFLRKTESKSKSSANDFVCCDEKIQTTAKVKQKNAEDQLKSNQVRSLINNGFKEGVSNCSTLTKVRVKCPVCDVEQLLNNNDEINNHIDTCLNRSTIQDLRKADVSKTLKRPCKDGKKQSKRPKTDKRIPKINNYFIVEN